MRIRWQTGAGQSSASTATCPNHGVLPESNVLPGGFDEDEDVVFDDPDSEDESGDPLDRERSDDAADSEEEG